MTTLSVAHVLQIQGVEKPVGVRVAVLDGQATHLKGRFGLDYIRLIGIGLLIALTGGSVPLLLERPFLSSGHLTLQLPLIGDLELASAMVFDTGVYLVVFGSVMLTLSMMGTIRPSRTRDSLRGQLDLQQRSARTGEVH